MKKLLLIFTLLFSTLMFSTPSYAEWTKVGTSVRGDNFYVDFERIRKHGGYVYFWELSDYLKPNKDGILSHKIYSEVDCKLFRFKTLSYSFHDDPMGRGTGEVSSSILKDWMYPSPDSVNEKLLKSVCSRFSQ
jgi:hypothetical protein